MQDVGDFGIFNVNRNESVFDLDSRITGYRVAVIVSCFGLMELVGKGRGVGKRYGGYESENYEYEDSSD